MTHVIFMGRTTQRLKCVKITSCLSQQTEYYGFLAVVRYTLDEKQIFFISEKFLWYESTYAFLGNPSADMIYGNVNMSMFLRYDAKYVL